ncbi:MAG: peptidyl-tRNA hydrolase [Planctomycetota bacterium]|nr:MAG: peptidyl-tRNA hydrolase [Planctomycetota bacterium]
MARLVVGLGNPGRRYARTRHNVGFRVLERLAERWGVALARRRFEGLYAVAATPQGQVVLLAPQTYMNESGRAVAAYARYYKVEPAQTLVVSDDIALPFGTLRLRAAGSAGGQKGLASVIAALGTEAFPRLRIGIGAPPPPMEAADYVLAPFAEEEERLLPEVIERAADCVQCWLAEGIDRAMSRFNAAPPA